MEITTEYSSWYIIGCAVLAGLYTFFLYWKNKQNADVSKTIVRFLSVLRFVTVFILAFLLLNPMIQKWITKTETPVIIIAQDVSASILNNKDSLYYKTDYLTELEELNQQIAENFEVVFMPFGGEVLPDSTAITFNEKRTNYSKVFDEVEARYAGDNIGAVVLATDGLFNNGANPKYYNFRDSYPVYTLGLGDTTVKSDIGITNLRSNEIVYLGNDFPIEVNINAQRLKGEKAELTISRNGKKLETKTLEINAENAFFTEQFLLPAEKEGTQRYQIKVTTFDNELNTINNSGEVLIDVIDNRDKVLLLCSAPHPDVAAIRTVLEAKDNVELDVAFVSDLNEVLSSYNLIIAHGFGDQKNMGIWQKVWDTKVPLWAIVNGSTSWGGLNRFKPGFSLTGNGKKTNGMTPGLNSDFSYFRLSDAVFEFLDDCPPLTCSHGEISGGTGSDVLLYQKLGVVVTDYPLQQFTSRDDQKTGWLFGEGIWQWRMFDFRESQNHERFDEWLSKTVQYLSVKEDKSRFRIAVKKRFTEGEQINFGAELYNKSYELISTEEVRLKLINEKEEEFNYVFNPMGSVYELNLGQLPAGVYSYQSETTLSGEVFTKHGKFVVKQLNVEWQKVSADFTVLQNLSERTGGAFFLPSQFSELKELFQAKENFPSVSYTSETKKSILHEKWIFFLILLLLTTEWGVRKYKGRY